MDNPDESVFGPDLSVVRISVDPKNKKRANHPVN
jgi:hypothetical protein